MGFGVAVASVAMGATIIEKHFTLARADGGVDSSFSLEPDELSSLVTETDRAWRSLGCVRYGPSEAEKKSLVFRRSIYVIKRIAKGDIFTTSNLGIIRPGDGAPPSLYQSIIGMRASRSYKKGEPFDLSSLSNA